MRLADRTIVGFFVVVLLACLVWVVEWCVTGFANPVFQSRAVLAQFSGPAFARSSAEFKTNQALFHLERAVRSCLADWEGERDEGMPTSWAHLIKDVGGFRGSHMTGSLLHDYPLLNSETDPWGRPWIYKVEKEDIDGGEDSGYRITLGSFGPDGAECDEPDGGKIRHRGCDDLILEFSLLRRRVK